MIEKAVSVRPVHVQRANGKPEHIELRAQHHGGVKVKLKLIDFGDGQLTSQNNSLLWFSCPSGFIWDIATSMSASVQNPSGVQEPRVCNKAIKLSQAQIVAWIQHASFLQPPKQANVSSIQPKFGKSNSGHLKGCQFQSILLRSPWQRQLRLMLDWLCYFTFYFQEKAPSPTSRFIDCAKRAHLWPPIPHSNKGLPPVPTYPKCSWYVELDMAVVWNCYSKEKFCFCIKMEMVLSRRG